MHKEKRDEYMARIDAEYRRYEADMCEKSARTVFEQATSVLAMRHAYDFLRSTAIFDDELEYVMQTRYPLREVAETHEAFESVSCAGNPIATTVFDIYDKHLFDDADTEKHEGHIPICFRRKSSSLWETIDASRDRPDDVYEIVKVVELSKTDFDNYSTRLLADMPFLQSNASLMRMDEQGCFHCVLVRDKSRNRGILVESDGFFYARYSAYVEDTRSLDLTHVPVEEYTLATPERSRKPKQQER